MSKIKDRFSKFLANLELSTIEIVEIQNRFEDVCETLHDNYYFLSYDQSTRVVIGSYGKNTAISPPTNVDVLFLMPQDEYYRYDDEEGNGQHTLLQDIKELLSSKYYYTFISEDDSTVVINFVSFNVRIKPAFLRANGIYVIPDISNGGEWSSICPSVEKTDLYNSNNRSKGNTIRLIKMMKAWKHHSNVPIKTFAIELSVIEFLNDWEYYDAQLSYFDWMIRDYLKALFGLINKSLDVPGVEDQLNFGSAWLEVASYALESASNACIYELNMDHTKATQEWVRIFGIRFPF